MLVTVGLGRCANCLQSARVSGQKGVKTVPQNCFRVRQPGVVLMTAWLLDPLSHDEPDIITHFVDNEVYVPVRDACRICGWKVGECFFLPFSRCFCFSSFCFFIRPRHAILELGVNISGFLVCSFISCEELHNYGGTYLTCAKKAKFIFMGRQISFTFQIVAKGSCWKIFLIYP